MSNDKSQPTRENRDYFRISQDVIFDFKVVDAFSAEHDQAESAFEDAVSLNLLHELRRLDRDNVQTLRLLTEKNRLLGDYLQTLSSKIDLIARHSLFSQHSNNTQKPTSRVNISEDGIAFLCDRALYKGNYLAIRLIFLPSYSPVITFAKVLRCTEKGEEYQVAAKFHQLSDLERQELSRQIRKAQVSERKTGGIGGTASGGTPSRGAHTNGNPQSPATKTKSSD